MTIEERITNYLGNGGLFNPEQMEHDKVRDLLIDCRAEMEACGSERDGQYELIGRLNKKNFELIQQIDQLRTELSQAREAAEVYRRRLDWLERNKLGVVPCWKDGTDGAISFAGWLVVAAEHQSFDFGIELVRSTAEEAIDAALSSPSLEKKL